MSTTFRFITYVLALVSVFLLNACTTTDTFKASVTTFQDWPPTGQDTPRTYSFVNPGVDEVSLKQQAYEHLVTPALEMAGFYQPGNTQPRYQVRIIVHSWNEQQTTQVPVYTPQPVYMPGYEDSFGSYYGGAWTYPWPMYEGTRTVVEPYLDAQLEIIIHDTHTLTAQNRPRPVYDTIVHTNSFSHSLLELIPFMAEAAMRSFPLENGSVQTVSFPFPKSQPDQ